MVAAASSPWSAAFCHRLSRAAYWASRSAAGSSLGREATDAATDLCFACAAVSSYSLRTFVESKTRDCTDNAVLGVRLLELAGAGTTGTGAGTGMRAGTEKGESVGAAGGRTALFAAWWPLS